MNLRAKAILQDALALPPEERAELSVELAASVDGAADADAEAAWAAEIERRARRAISGETTGDDWEVVRSRIEKRLRQG